MASKHAAVFPNFYSLANGILHSEMTRTLSVLSCRYLFSLSIAACLSSRKGAIAGTQCRNKEYRAHRHQSNPH